jgi:hypothetical protein
MIADGLTVDDGDCIRALLDGFARVLEIECVEAFQAIGASSGSRNCRNMATERFSRGSESCGPGTRRQEYRKTKRAV